MRTDNTHGRQLPNKGGDMKTLLVIGMLFLIGCSSTSQKYYYQKEMFDETEGCFTVETCKAKTIHKTKFTDKKIDRMTSEVSVEQVRTTVGQYTSEVNEESIEALEKPIKAGGSAAGSIIGTTLHDTVMG